MRSERGSPLYDHPKHTEPLETSGFFVSTRSRPHPYLPQEGQAERSALDPLAEHVLYTVKAHVL